MLIDGRLLAPDTVLRADLCIVGAGAAGITMARELRGSGLQVLVLESGAELEPDTADQELSEGTVVGRPYQPLAATRVRVLGGTTHHWNGLCHPLEGVDFEERPGIAHTGWPFGLDHLQPFLDRAAEVVEIGPSEFSLAWWTEHYGLPPSPVEGPDLDVRVFQHSTPTHFGRRYRNDLAEGRGTGIVLHANAVEVETPPDAATVSGIVAQVRGGVRFRVEARGYVLAAGALESTRLLLASRAARPAGLGNDHDLVGRFLQDHPHLTAGPVVLASGDEAMVSFAGANVTLSPDHRTRAEPHVQGIRAVLSLSEDARRREGLLGVSASLQLGVPFGLDQGIAGPFEVLVGGLHEVPRGRAFRLGIIAEQAPDPESRVTLTEERDAVGLPRLAFDWRLGALEEASIGRTVALIASAVGGSGLGVGRIEASEDGLFTAGALGGPHHLGTLRMAARPRNGVVDPDCRVHGIANLWVAGGATFPTSGWANPTLTIVAMALRLADHLRVVLR